MSKALKKRHTHVPPMRRLHWGRFVVKEPLSSFSHGFGALVALSSGILLWTGSWSLSLWQLMAASVFLLGAFVQYLISALYHGLPLTLSQEKRMRKWDHSAIFFFIACCYVPPCLLTLEKPLGFWSLAAVWGVGALGIALTWSKRKLGPASAFAYIAMGWMAVMVIVPLWKAMPPLGFSLLLGGGLAYSAGGVMYALRKPNPMPRYLGFHELFHVACLVGTGLQGVSFWLSRG